MPPGTRGFAVAFAALFCFKKRSCQTNPSRPVSRVFEARPNDGREFFLIGLVSFFYVCIVSERVQMYNFWKIQLNIVCDCLF
jgi:hypothetical protein